jgi:asparagine synthase (glutamine-hydrolysing)
MPGITGIISNQPHASYETVLAAMLGCMRHETSYTSGTYVNEQNGLWVGWTCHEEAFGDCMPVWNEARDICLIFAGEDFTEQAEIDDLRRKGHVFGTGNADYLVHLYEERGIVFLETLNGWFSGILIDLRQPQIVLFNDRYGLQRIYYHQTANGYYFSSEAKSLLEVLPDLRRLDLPSFGEAVACGCVLQDRTLFSGVSLLPGGAKWTFSRNQQVRKESYFRREVWESQPLLKGQEFYSRLKETFARVLPKYFRGKERLGMSLTGGLDGRMILAWADCAPATLPCYTFGSVYRDCTDVKVARKVAAACHQSHQVLTVDGRFLREFPQLAERAVYISDGAMDVTGAVELYVNRIAKTIAHIRLTGNYGSEILRGNVAFKPHSVGELPYDPEFLRLVGATEATYAMEAQCHNLSFIAFKQVPWHHYSRLAVEQSQLTLRAPYLDNDLVALIYQAPPDLAVSQEPSLRLIAAGNPALSRIPTDRGLLQRPIPVLTRARNLYEEFTFRAEYAYDYGMPQWLARLDHAVAPLHLERVFLGRHKFFHFRVWYRDQLSEYIRDVLLDERTRSRPYLRGNKLEGMVESHIKGNRNYTSEIHRILTCELIQRQLIERK